MNILKDEDDPEDADRQSAAKQQLLKLLPWVFCRVVQCGGGWEDWWWFLLFGGGEIDVSDEFAFLWETSCLTIQIVVTSVVMCLRKTGNISHCCLGNMQITCIARWKICSVGNCTDADLPVSITMMDSSLTEVSAVSNA